VVKGARGVLILVQVLAEGDIGRSIDAQDLCKDLRVSFFLLLPSTRGQQEMVIQYFYDQMEIETLDSSNGMC
jgi:hypothetical protein